MTNCAHHKFPKPKLTSSSCLFSLNKKNPTNIKFTKDIKQSKAANPKMFTC